MIYGVPYAYDRIAEGQTEGGSIERCTSLIKFLTGESLQDELNTVFVLTAGYTKASPTLPTDDASVPICDQMRDYLVYTLGVDRDNFICIPEVWGTYEETRAAIREINYDSNDIVGDVTVLVCTNPGHLPRVKMCWYFLAPNGWKVKFVPASHSFGGMREHLQETFKFLVYLYRFVAKKW